MPGRILDGSGVVIRNEVQFQEEKMHTKDAIQFALTVSNGAVLSAIDEMSGAATTFPTPNGGCHPLWVLGHLTLVEGMIPAVLFGDKNPAAEWQQYFGENSEPVSDPSAYPPLTEVREKYLQLREQNLKLLESLSEEDLDKPTKGATQRTGAGVRHLRAELPRAGPAPDDASRQRHRCATRGWAFDGDTRRQ
jgi:hypothetical protein